MSHSIGETRRALFHAALAAQVADEPNVSAHRIVAALLRSDAVRQFCARAGIDVLRAVHAADDERDLPYDECELRVKDDLIAKGLEPGSQEHRATLQERPLDPVLASVFDSVLRMPGQLSVSPLSLLLEVLRAHPLLAARLAEAGLTIEEIDADLGKEKS